ncbi:uncharacterized protein LOC6729668 [Drosophila simulans]|uniref:uncharacterized protein LOC6729668 n=1 Tax=Drosophila simulans TaxID=7240 RepID=UPI00078AEB68|nr:uncharacterized protein LOC6729668 [Drosophila simulans]KMZ05955.1 uncharacterized protein Dsimw501_GD21236 [Drosophila simulans]
MRIALPRLLCHILLYHLFLISSSLASCYQRHPSSPQHQQQSRSQLLDQSGDINMGMRHGNSKQAASNIAQKAAQEAKKASDTQAPAALAAARQVKHHLAEKAIAAAKAAEAALAGKQQLMEQLQDEVHEAEIIVQEEAYSLVGSQSNVNVALATAKQCQTLLQSLRSSVKVAEEAVSNAEAAASGAQQELCEKNQLVDTARQRAEMLLQQLRSAKLDYTNTRKAAYRAACAANEAKNKAVRDRRSYEEDIGGAFGQQQQQVMLQNQDQPRNLQDPEVKAQGEGWEYNEQGEAIFSN